MDYCGPRGLAHSVFLGWDADDRDKALWWLIYDGRTCRSCGTRPDEWDPENGGDLHAYEAHMLHCRGCEVAAQAQERLDQGMQAHEYRRGTRVGLRRPPDDTGGA